MKFIKPGLILFVIAILLAFGLFKLKNYKYTPTSITPTQVEIYGTITCLPHKNKTGPQTMECAFGLKDDAGKFYGLKNMSQQDTMSVKTTGKRVIVAGVLSSDPDSKYDIESSIDVQSIN